MLIRPAGAWYQQEVLGGTGDSNLQKGLAPCWKRIGEAPLLFWKAGYLVLYGFGRKVLGPYFKSSKSWLQANFFLCECLISWWWAEDPVPRVLSCWPLLRGPCLVHLFWGSCLGDPPLHAFGWSVVYEYVRESCKRQSAQPQLQLMLELHGLTPRLSIASQLEVWMEWRGCWCCTQRSTARFQQGKITAVLLSLLGSAPHALNHSTQPTQPLHNPHNPYITHTTYTTPHNTWPAQWAGGPHQAPLGQSPGADLEKLLCRSVPARKKVNGKNRTVRKCCEFRMWDFSFSTHLQNSTRVFILSCASLTFPLFFWQWDMSITFINDTCSLWWSYVSMFHVYSPGDSMFSIQNTKFRPARIICQQKCHIPFCSVHSAEPAPTPQGLEFGFCIAARTAGSPFSPPSVTFQAGWPPGDWNFTIFPHVNPDVCTEF